MSAAAGRLRVAILTRFYTPAYRGGGPIRTISAMVAVHGERHDFDVLTSNGDWGVVEPLPVPTDTWVDVGSAKVWYAGRRSPRSRWSGLVAVRRRRPDVLYLNGVFPFVMSIIPLLLHRLRFFGPAQVVLAPRGEFGSGAFALKSWKKRGYLTIAGWLGWYDRVTWHASSDLEAAEIRQVFPQARVLVRPNEVELPTVAPSRVGREPGPLRLVFLSRLAPKKGLGLLLEALAQVTAPVCLDVYGSGDPSYVVHCEDEAQRLPGTVTVRFHGPVEPAQVAGVFAGHDAFAFPTAHENFGHVIAESLAAGCPVLLPDVTPWTPVIERGGGVLLPSRTAAPWADAIQRLATSGPEDWARMSAEAAAAYAMWVSTLPVESVFDLLGSGTPTS